MGPREVQLHLVREVQEVYRSQGVSIHDKHIEVIIRQMLKRVMLIDSGVDRVPARPAGRAVAVRGGEPAGGGRGRRARRPGRPVLMGITKASLATESWLSAASFQETTRVLTDAAIQAKSDALRRPQGERHHRQADPGRHRHLPVPQHPGGADRGGPRAGLLDGRVRRVGLLRRHRLRPGFGPGGAAGGLRLRGPALPVVVADRGRPSPRGAVSPPVRRPLGRVRPPPAGMIPAAGPPPYRDRAAAGTSPRSPVR